MSHRPTRYAPILVLGSVAMAASLITGYFIYRSYATRLQRTARLMTWLRSPGAHPDWRVAAGERCRSAPFMMPTNGYIGFLWDDSFRFGHHHQGIDIFGGEQVDQTPVMAAYPGFLTRLPDWKSSVIIRIPQDPLNPSQQIWTYYTHMADPQGHSFISPQFPPGTSEIYIPAGTLLGYQGNYSGTPGNPTGVHLHFSVVKDDGQGMFRNELKIENTLDPSAYLGLSLNANLNSDEIPTCKPVRVTGNEEEEG